MRRVVVTGLGIVSSIGNNAQEVLASLREAKSGVVKAEDYARLGFRCQVHGAPKLDLDSAVEAVCHRRSIGIRRVSGEERTPRSRRHVERGRRPGLRGQDRGGANRRGSDAFVGAQPEAERRAVTDRLADRIAGARFARRAQPSRAERVGHPVALRVGKRGAKDDELPDVAVQAFPVAEGGGS